ncbi:phage tail protein [Xenorhabdus sp. XENO-10]|uniref:Phage tail protein n=1 Tax=Xenorhabdus yunnanensis TaxID=3025878 RepID=A0ABT5LI07_9GAMM|nr:phage tail protein [Xenorhabdus yunnanensis]MDC9590734.1 phage tail protein [Xenorhabdus yunnanensis]
MSRYDEWLHNIPDSEITGMESSQIQPTINIPVQNAELVDLDDVQSSPTTEILKENQETPERAVLPQHLFARAQDLDLKPRFKGHSPLNDLVRQDWIKMVEEDSNSYDALLYRPVDDVPTKINDDGLEIPIFTEFNNNQQELSYTDPQRVIVLDCPDERESFNAVDSDGDQDGGSEDFLVIRAATTSVPIGSIFEWNEELSDKRLARRFWYVLRIFTYGTASVGSLYYCIPARNFNQSALGTDNEQR